MFLRVFVLDIEEKRDCCLPYFTREKNKKRRYIEFHTQKEKTREKERGRERVKEIETLKRFTKKLVQKYITIYVLYNVYKADGLNS